MRDILIKEVVNAILRGACVVTVGVDKEYFTITNLPSPQRAGSETQKLDYAKQAAEDCVDTYLTDSLLPVAKVIGGAEWEMIATAVETVDSDSVHVWQASFIDPLGRFSVYYATKCEKTRAVKYYVSTIDPSKMTDEQRHEVLDYTLGAGNYDAEEIVNYMDLFLHSGYLIELKHLK